MQASKAYICATQHLGLSSKSVSYQVKDEYAPNLFKKKKKFSKNVLSGFLEVGVGQVAQAMASHPPLPSPPLHTHTHLKFKEEVAGGGGGRASCPGHGILFPTPFQFREKQLMINIINIQMTGQYESLLSDKLSFRSGVCQVFWLRCKLLRFSISSYPVKDAYVHKNQFCHVSVIRIFI